MRHIDMTSYFQDADRHIISRRKVLCRLLGAPEVSARRLLAMSAC